MWNIIYYMDICCNMISYHENKAVTKFGQCGEKYLAI